MQFFTKCSLTIGDNYTILYLNALMLLNGNSFLYCRQQVIAFFIVHDMIDGREAGVASIGPSMFMLPTYNIDKAYEYSRLPIS